MNYRIIVLATLAALTIAGCSRETSADIRSIDISKDGTNVRVARDLAQFPLEEFRGLQTHAGLMPDGSTVATLRIRYADGSQERGIAPASLRGGGISSQITRLVKWMTTAPFFSDRTTVRRQRALFDAFRTNAVRSISLHERRGYGTCAIYAATFRADGTASLDVTSPRCAGSGNASVAFARIARIVAFQSPSLLAYYQPRAQDTPSASLTIATSSQTFVSAGPDASTWGRPFIEIEARLDQLVRDTAWNPHVDLSCAQS